MHIEETLQRAVNQFDWQAVEDRLRTVPADGIGAWMENFLDVVLRDGYLILRRTDTRQEQRRESFLDRLREYLEGHGLTALLDERADGFEGAGHAEAAYREVLHSLRTDLQSRLTPEEFAWAAVRSVDEAGQQMERQIRSALPQLAALVDPVEARLPVDAEGGIANPDQVLNIVQGTGTATLKMVGYEHGWFDREGLLVLPLPVPTTDGHRMIAGGNMYLASVWNQLERSDSRSRYFAGRVGRREVEFRYAEDGNGTVHRAEAITFDFENDLEIELHLAGERRKRRLFSSFMDLDRDAAAASRVVPIPPVPAAPRGYVSLWEIHAALALSGLFFKSILEVATAFAGLTLPEWVRGYAVIQKLAREHLAGPAPADGLVMVTEQSILESLVGHGLPAEKAPVFLRHVCFGKRSDDLFDAPFVRCSDGRLCFVRFPAAFMNPSQVVLSQLSALRCDLAWKGVPFEEDTVALFREHGIDAAGIHRWVDGEEFQCDCVALWDEILFVCECKNYFLPGDNPQSEFWFLKDQADAVRQVSSKVRVIESHPELVDEALGGRRRWTRIVPVVLNGAPFSLLGPIDGAYVYDASALHRFFEEGDVAVVAASGGAARQPVPGGVTRLWSGEQPSAADLLRQLECPVQIMHALALFRRGGRVIPLSPRLHMSTTVIERIESTPETLAAAIGIHPDALGHGSGPSPAPGA